MKLFVLFEHAAGYACFKSSTEDVLEVSKGVQNVENFKNMVDLAAFQPFGSGRNALENMNSVSEGILHPDLEAFLESVPKLIKKKSSNTLGVSESKLGAAIQEKLEINCSTTGIIPELLRGIRKYFHHLVEGFTDSTAKSSQLGLGHHYSRARVKFNVNRIDNMIIQSISLVDQLDKDINTFSMRVREWYSHHFPELIRIVPENALFVQCLRVIQNRKELAEDVAEKLEEIVKDPIKVQNILEVAQNSMGMDISPLDLENVYAFAERILSLMQRRKELQEYLRAKMHSIAPNLAALIGDAVGARLIAHAGSLTNLAKYPASTVQILGAEKALFRAIKTHGNTPKYGLIYHSRFISKAAKSNKGRISRYLANKCSVASRIDCFRDVPTDVFGCKLRDQVEERLKFFETGQLPATNIDVMDKAVEEAEVAEVAYLKAIKKAKKKAKKLHSESQSDGEGLEVSIKEEAEEEVPVEETSAKKKKKKRKHSERADESLVDENGGPTQLFKQENGDSTTPKKKKKKSHSVAE